MNYLIQRDNGLGWVTVGCDLLRWAARSKFHGQVEGVACMDM